MFSSAFAASKQLYSNPWARQTAAFAIGGPILSSLSSRVYSNQLQREQYQYEKQGHQRWIDDYERNTGRKLRYPELSHPGRIRALDTGIGQAYSSDFSAMASAERSVGFSLAGGYRRPRSLYSRSTGRSSRYL